MEKFGEFKVPPQEESPEETPESEQASSQEQGSGKVFKPEFKKADTHPYPIKEVEGEFEVVLPGGVDMETGQVVGWMTEKFPTKEEAEQALESAIIKTKESGRILPEIYALEKAYDKYFFKVEQTSEGKFKLFMPALVDLKTGGLVGTTWKEFDTWDETKEYFLREKEQAEKVTHEPILELQTAPDEKFAFSEFDAFHPRVAPSEKGYELPTSVADYMTEKSRLDGTHDSASTYQRTIEEEGWQENLFSFLNSYLKNQGAETVAALGIKHLSALTPRQAVELSTQVVIDLTKYNYGEMEARNGASESDQKTALQILQEGLREKRNPNWEGNGVCRNFASSVKAVFEALKAKQTKLSRLNNTYCLYESGDEYKMERESLRVSGKISPGHAWNTFMTISKEGAANATIIDTTWGKRNLETKQIENFDHTLDRMEPLVFTVGKNLEKDSPDQQDQLRKILSYYLLAIESPVNKLKTEKEKEFLTTRVVELMWFQGVPDKLPTALIDKLNEQYERIKADEIDSREIETLYQISHKYSELNFKDILKRYLEGQFDSVTRHRGFMVRDNHLQVVIFEQIKSDERFEEYKKVGEFRSRVREVSPHLLPEFSPMARAEDLKELKYLLDYSTILELKDIYRKLKPSGENVNDLLTDLREKLQLKNPDKYDQIAGDLDDYQLVKRYSEIKKEIES